jgi:hypothetical protein
MSLMLLTPIPWAQRIWALPVMTVLSPSERYYQQRGRCPQTLLERSAQMLKLLRRWRPQRRLVVVGDSASAALDCWSQMQQLTVTLVTRLRLDAAWYDPAPPSSGQGRPRKKGKLLPTLAQVLKAPDTLWTTTPLPGYDGQKPELPLTSACTVWFHTGKAPLPIRWVLVRDPQGDYAPLALLGTEPATEPQAMVTWFVTRWPLEVPFEAARRHLGVETQRQWSDQAIARTTPLLLGLVRLGHAGGSCPVPCSLVRFPTPICLVCPILAHLLRCSGVGSPILVGGLSDFSNIEARTRPVENSQTTLRYAGFDLVLCRLMCKVELITDLSCQISLGDKLRPEPLEYRVWGEEYIDPEALAQIDNAMRLPVSIAGALMPDAHVGYGLPIGTG